VNVIERLRIGAAGRTTVVAMVPTGEVAAVAGDGAAGSTAVAGAGVGGPGGSADETANDTAGVLPYPSSSSSSSASGAGVGADGAIAAAARAGSALGELRALAAGGFIELVEVASATATEAGARAREWREGVDAGLPEEARERLLESAATDGSYWL